MFFLSSIITSVPISTVFLTSRTNLFFTTSATSTAEEIDLPRAFIVPGGSPGSGALDLARSLLRTAERRVVALNEDGKLVATEVLRYLNRLSDLLFMLARLEDKDLPVELSTGDSP